MKLTTNFEYAKKKAMKEVKQSNNKKWWKIHTKDYSFPFWLLPIYPFVLFSDWLENWLYNHMEWDEKRAIKIVDYILPHYLEYFEKEKAYYLCMDWGFSEYYKFVPLWHKNWVKKFSYSLAKFIEDKYEKEGYDKKVYDNWSEGWIVFKEKT